MKFSDILPTSRSQRAAVRFGYALLSILAAAPATSHAMIRSQPMGRPRLIVAIVFDQFRADYLMRFRSRFLPAKSFTGKLGGFEYLMTEGAYFPYAQYDIQHSMTGPGHATVLSGAYPYRMGIPLNYWYDHEKNESVYCVADSDTLLIGTGKSEARPGASPKFFQGSTVGDEIKNAGYPSRVISVAIKDRAAILMGGKRPDLAFWLDSATLQWVTSSYYIKTSRSSEKSKSTNESVSAEKTATILSDQDLPQWMKTLNQDLAKRANEIVNWSAPTQSTGYSAASALPLLNEKNAGSLGGPNFPHSAALKKGRGTSMPAGLEMTVDAALAAVAGNNLGANGRTDLLAVSFSSHDYMGHAYGPNSREMEEMTVADDLALSRLLNGIKSQVPGGLKEVVIVLTADHGIAPNPDWVGAAGVPAGRIDEETFVNQLEDKLTQKFGKPSPADGESSQSGKWVVWYRDFNFWFNRDSIRKKGVDFRDFSRFARAAAMALPDFRDRIAHIVTASDGLEPASASLPGGVFARQFKNTFFRDRSGDLAIIPRPFFIQDKDDTTTHITGYEYDRTVPLLISGFRIRRGVFANTPGIIDIAPTLTFLNQTIPPAQSEGRVLSEIIQSSIE